MRWRIPRVGFLYWSCNLYLIFVICVLSSPARKIRLEGEGAKPEFGYLSWLAMLFSAGMGIGLLFYSVAEPLYHLASPAHSDVDPLTRPSRWYSVWTRASGA